MNLSNLIIENVEAELEDAFDDLEKQKECISFLKNSIQINPNNAY